MLLALKVRFLFLQWQSIYKCDSLSTNLHKLIIVEKSFQFPSYPPRPKIQRKINRSVSSSVMWPYASQYTTALHNSWSAHNDNLPAQIHAGECWGLGQWRSTENKKRVAKVADQGPPNKCCVMFWVMTSFSMAVLGFIYNFTIKSDPDLTQQSSRYPRPHTNLNSLPVPALPFTNILRHMQRTSK